MLLSCLHLLLVSIGFIPCILAYFEEQKKTHTFTILELGIKNVMQAAKQSTLVPHKKALQVDLTAQFFVIL